MKTVTVQTLSVTIESILKEQEKLAQVHGQKFVGITEANLVRELDNKLGLEWSLRKDNPIKLTMQDMNAVANSRFMRGEGSRILMALAIVVLGLGSLAQFRVIPVPVYLGVSGVSAFLFLWYFTKKQVESRKTFKKNIDGDGVN